MALKAMLWAAYKIGRRVGSGEITQVTGGQYIDRLYQGFVK